MARYTNNQLAKVINDHGIDEYDASLGKPTEPRYNPKKSLRPRLRTKEMEKRQARKTKLDLYKTKDEMWAAEDARLKANSKYKKKTTVTASPASKPKYKKKPTVKANPKSKPTYKKKPTVVRRSTQPNQMKTVNNKRGR